LPKWFGADFADLFPLNFLSLKIIIVKRITAPPAWVQFNLKRKKKRIVTDIFSNIFEGGKRNRIYHLIVKLARRESLFIRQIRKIPSSIILQFYGSSFDGPWLDGRTETYDWETCLHTFTLFYFNRFKSFCSHFWYSILLALFGMSQLGNRRSYFL
jgi:hypothetical protein